MGLGKTVQLIAFLASLSYTKSADDRTTGEIICIDYQITERSMEIITGRPTDRQTDGQEGQQGNYTINKKCFHGWMEGVNLQHLSGSNTISSCARS